MNQSINTDSKNSKKPQQKYRLGTVSIKILGGINRFYGRPTSSSASIMAQNIQLFGPRGGFLTHQWSRRFSDKCDLSLMGVKIVIFIMYLYFRNRFREAEIKMTLLKTSKNAQKSICNMYCANWIKSAYGHKIFECEKT